MMDQPAKAWICVFLGLALYTVALAFALHETRARGGRRVVSLLLPPALSLLFAKTGYEFLQFGEIASIFRWCFTAGLAGLLAGTASAARISHMKAETLLDRTAPMCCVAMAFARWSQRWLGEVGAGPWLEEGSVWFRSPFALQLNEWDENVLAVFVPETLFALLAALMVFFYMRNRRKGPSGPVDGGAALLAVLLLAVPQILLEQFRTGHYMQWRMVRAEQVLCALVSLAAMLLYCAGHGNGSAGIRKAAVPGAVFLGLCGVIALIQFVLDGKLADLPEPVCWAVYAAAVGGMLAAGCACLQGRLDSRKKRGENVPE